MEGFFCFYRISLFALFFFFFLEGNEKVDGGGEQENR